MKTNHKENKFKFYMDKAILELKNRNYESARGYIFKAMMIDDSAPEIHNLFGIFYELNRNIDLAHKHYSASYSLNATFRPARNNLQRISDFSYKYSTCNIDYGNNEENIEKQLYTVTYDENNIGKFVKIN